MARIQPYYFILLIGMVLLLGGCQEKPCSEFACDNGTCMEGECICDDFYEGDACNILETQKFIGDWSLGDICSNGPAVYDMSITAADQEGRIRFSVLGPDRLPVFAEVNDTLLNIYEQAYGLAVISGAGGIDTINQVITLDYDVDYGQGNSVNCLTSLEK